mmetsp:Transcript_35632/g.96649  ORF Transcript_35632/g.96649 Transcript_35632/m.96649 type:complete len:202 (+) Transcript_35632:336-941(+)
MACGLLVVGLHRLRSQPALPVRHAPLCSLGLHAMCVGFCAGVGDPLLVHRSLAPELLDEAPALAVACCQRLSLLMQVLGVAPVLVPGVLGCVSLVPQRATQRRKLAALGAQGRKRRVLGLHGLRQRLRHLPCSVNLQLRLLQRQLVRRPDLRGLAAQGVQRPVQVVLRGQQLAALRLDVQGCLTELRNLMVALVPLLHKAI